MPKPQNLPSLLPFRFQVPRSMFIHRVDVVRMTMGYDDAGGTVPIPKTIFKMVPCFVQTPDANEREQFGRFAEVMTHAVYMIDNPGIIDEDKLMFPGGQPAAQQRELIVKGVQNMLEANVGWSIPCVETVLAPLK